MSVPIRPLTSKCRGRSGPVLVRSHCLQIALRRLQHSARGHVMVPSDLVLSTEKLSLKLHQDHD